MGPCCWAWWRTPCCVAGCRPRQPAPLALCPPPLSSSCRAAGTLEDHDEAGAGAGGNKKESAEDQAARVKLEAAKARESVRQALQTGLEAGGSKRKAPEGGGGGQGGGGKRGMLDSMLGDLSSSDEEEGSDA